MNNFQDYRAHQDPPISEQTRSILTKYSNIPEEELVAHIRAIRDKAWTVFQYPCIGNYHFLDFSIGNSAVYDHVVRRMKQGARLLDLGCCFGQDIRKLVFDGCPPENITGSELEPSFVEFGYDLFRDRETLNVSFKCGDFFAPDTAGLKGQTFDIIHAASFFHLFTWDEQIEAMSRAVGMLKKQAGSMIFGRQAGYDVAGPFEKLKARSGPMFVNSVESYKELLKTVAERTEVKLGVEVGVTGQWFEHLGGGFKILSFVIRILE